MGRGAGRSARLQHAIALTPDGYFHLRTVLILGLGNAADAIEILSIGYILAVYEDKEGELSRGQQSALAAAIFAGMFVGGIVFGPLSDQVGRRTSLLYSLSLNAVFALLSSLSPGIYTLILCRSLAGVGIGGTVPAMFTLCSEHVPAHRRGFYVTLVASYWMVGSVFTAGLAWFMLGDPATRYSWRAFAAVASTPAFVCWWLTYHYVPESAQYLARQRLFSDAEQVVNQIRIVNGGTQDNGVQEATEGTRLLSPYRSPAASNSVGGSASVELKMEDLLFPEPTIPSVTEAFALLFDPVLRVTTVALFLTWACLSFGSYGIATWITVLFKRINLSDPFANAFIYAAANLPGNILSALVMDRLGGKRLLAISLLFAGACAAGFAYVNNSSAEVSKGTAFAIVALAGGFNAFTTAAWNAIDLMSTESFPTDVRTTGMGILASGGRSASVIAQFVNGYLVGPPPHVTALLVITASMMVIGSVSATLVRDYSNKELPESVEEMRREVEGRAVLQEKNMNQQ